VHTTLDGNKPGKDDQLTQAGADAAATELDEITTALSAAPRPCAAARAAELSRIWIKAARSARRGPALASASGLGEAPAAARRPSRHKAPLISQAHRAGSSAALSRPPRRSSVPLPAAVSRSLPAVAPHAIGSAEPNDLQ